MAAGAATISVGTRRLITNQKIETVYLVFHPVRYGQGQQTANGLLLLKQH